MPYMRSEDIEIRLLRENKYETKEIRRSFKVSFYGSKDENCAFSSLVLNNFCAIFSSSEIRQAPQMDSLVAIYVSMGNAAGMDFMASQAAPDASMNPGKSKFLGFILT